MSRIGVDVDGVLAQFDQAFTDVIIKETGRDLFGDGRYLPTFPSTWNWPQAFGYTDVEVGRAWKAVHQSARFWLGLPLQTGVGGEGGDLDALDLLADSGHDIYFITARKGQSAKRQTEEWLERGGMEFPTVLLAADKYAALTLLNLDCYIDDNATTVNEMMMKIRVDELLARVYMTPRPWNNEAIDVGVKIVPSVRAMLVEEGVIGREWLVEKSSRTENINYKDMTLQLEKEVGING